MLTRASTRSLNHRAFSLTVGAVIDPPPVSRTPLIRSLRAGKLFDGQDEIRVHARVQTRGGGAAGEQRPAAHADRGRTRDPTLGAEAVALGNHGRLPATDDSRVTGNRACVPSAPPSDRAAEIACLRRELDWTRMERDVLKKRGRQSWLSGSLWTRRRLMEARHVPHPSSRSRS